MQFIKATKEQAKLRLAIFGPSGSGKTYTSLRLATGLGGKIAFIDTERGSASMYADRFTFDVLELPKTDIATYVAGITAASAYDVLIIDSLSHAWFALLDEVEKLARAKYRGNTWSAWSEGTPKQRAMVDALLGFDGHIIATMRVKTEWMVEKTSSGKNRPINVGLAPQQGKGIEYEFDLLIQLTQEHLATVMKDRTGKFQDQIIDKPGEDFGKSLADWLKEGAAPKRKRKADAEPETFKPEAAKAKAKSNGRPLSPADLREALHEKATKYGAGSVTVRQIPFLARKFAEAFAPADDAKERYHLSLGWLWNDMETIDSATKLTFGMASATLDWLLAKGGPDSSGDTPLHEHAPAEAAGVYKAALKEQGQADMFDDEEATE